MNPFTKPEEIDKKLTEEIRNYIKIRISKGNFSFHDILDKLQENVKGGNEKESRIIAYYATNTILTNKNLSKYKKEQMILDIKKSLEVFQF